MPPEPVPAPNPAPELLRDAVVEKLRDTLETVAPVVAEVAQNERSTPLTEPAPGMERAEGPEPVKGAADLAAQGIGAAAGYIADQLAEFFAPTPPEVREQRANDEARREAERPAPDTANRSEYARFIESVIKEAQREAEEKRARGYWEERDRGKDFGRDR